MPRRSLLLPLTGVAVVLVALVEAGADPGPQGFGRGAWLALSLLPPFVVAVRFPAVALVLLSLHVPLTFLLDLPGVGGTALIALVALTAHLARTRPLRPALVGYAAAVLLPAVTLFLFGETVWEFLFFSVILGVAFALGLLLRREAERSEQLRRLAAELEAQREARAHAAVVEERARISRELHDAVAHAVSVMTLQVGVVRRRLGDRPVERSALESVEMLGRQSVDELRRVVGLLRDDEADPAAATRAPAPSLTRLEDLVEPVRRAGLPVDVVVTGEQRALPSGLDLSAYRVVQEALTNVLRHAGARRVRVTLDWAPERLVLEVLDDGSGAVGTRVGTGTVTMRERVALYGGSLTAGPGPAGGHRVHAVLPLPPTTALPAEPTRTQQSPVATAAPEPA